MLINIGFTTAKKLFFFSFIFLAFSCLLFSAQAQTYVLTKTREPKINVKNYKQIAIGDITGSSGRQTEESLNLSDELSSRLFNANAQEILDRNALEKIISSGSELTLIDDKTVAILKKKLNSAVLLTGRIQSNNVTQEEISSKNVVVVNGCYYSYNWKATCEIIVQVKVVDISTGKMLYNSPVTKKSIFESKAGCERTQKFDPSYIASKTLKEVAGEITQLLVPYKEDISITFQAGTLLKNPFKKIYQVIKNFDAGDFESGLKILKDYTEDNSLKEKFREQAYFNYALGLFCSNRFEEAKAEMKKIMSASPGSLHYEQWYAKIDAESASDKKLAMNK